jgi:hypothetical protein
MIPRYVRPVTFTSGTTFIKYQDVPRGKFKSNPSSSDPVLSKAFDQYIESVILSDDAKKFLIARELQRGIKSRHFYEATFPIIPLCIMAPIFSGMKSGLAGKKILLKGAVTALVFGTTLMFYFWMSDWWRRRTDQILDESAAGLGESYARGGVEFYDKMLRRHIAFRELLPENRGKKLYNLKGESFPGLLREKQIPISVRRDCCKTFLNKSA